MHCHERARAGGIQRHARANEPERKREATGEEAVSRACACVARARGKAVLQQKLVCEMSVSAEEDPQRLEKGCDSALGQKPGFSKIYIGWKRHRTCMYSVGHIAPT